MKTYATLALLLLVTLPAAAQAPRTDIDTENRQWLLAEKQLVVSLESPVALVRAQSLKNAIIFATLYRDKVDLSHAVGAIRKVYEKDSRAGNRELALAALHAIGDGRAVDFLARHVTPEAAEESRVVLVTVLNEFYQSRRPARTPAAPSSSR